jgi:hypothetical protein
MLPKRRETDDDNKSRSGGGFDSVVFDSALFSVRQ